MAFLDGSGLERLWAKITSKLNNKVDKVSGKGLSTNDYTTAEKNKLAEIASGANKTVVDSSLSSSSTNPVQNKVVNAAISNLNTLVGDKSVSTQINSVISSTKYAGSSSVGGAANSAVKLSTARTINVSGQATGTAQSFDGSANISIPINSIKKSGMVWGSDSCSGDIWPLDAAMSYLHSANRAQFAKPAGITVEYSTNGGSTWTDYGLSDASKIQLVSGIGVTCYLGKVNSGTSSADNMLRITIHAANCGFYTNLKAVLVEVSTSGSIAMKVKVEKAMRGSETTFSDYNTYNVSGWSGWNSLPLVLGAFGGGSTQTGNTGALRFTFSYNGTPASNQYGNVVNMIFLGTTYWSTPSNMAKTGHLYSWDYNQNATFPAAITATSFNGKATSSANADKVNNHTVESNVPSNAKFTDTTYSVATTSANGLMSSTDKSKLDGVESGANKTVVDSELNANSVNPVQNKIISKSITNLNSLVGDTAVATQITSATNSFINGLSISGTTITYTKGDGTVGTIKTQDTNTTYSDMNGATASTAGTHGLVPAPAAGKNTSFLRGDGTWVIPTNTTYSVASTSTAGLMSPSDKQHLDELVSNSKTSSIQIVRW